MKTISISEAKAQLSEQIRHVRRGEEVVITDRGRPVARLVPIEDKGAPQDLDELVSAGLARRGRGRLPRRFWSRPRPSDPQASVRKAVERERGEGW